MSNILSNSWVVSIVSGILVFFVTNFFVIFKSKRESRKLMYDANYMVLNHIRGYVVDNGLPSQRIIEAVKSSVAREYGVSCLDLLSDKEICEELIKDIIGNSYISNDNKKNYINMLEKYIEQNEDISDANVESINREHNGHTYRYISTVISIIAGFITTIGVNLTTIIKNMEEVTGFININNVINAVSVVIVIIISSTILYYIGKKKK